MRFFIALEIPEDCRQELETVQQNLQKIIPGVRLTNNNKLHLTIAFIGEQPDELKDELISVVKKAVFGISPFKVTPAYIDGFPNLHQAHIFWVGLKGDIDKLFVVRERIKDGIEKLGIDMDDRRYLPHIAVAKINDNFQIQEGQELSLEKMMMNGFSPIQISSIKLFESIPEEGFHKHNTLAQISLEESSQSNPEPEVL